MSEEDTRVSIPANPDEIPPIAATVHVKGEPSTIYHLDPHAVYNQLHGVIVKLSGAQPADDANPLAKQMARVVKAALKALLMMWGDKLLTLFIGDPHDKPGKKDDLVDWYTDMFAKVGVTYLVLHPPVLSGQRANEFIVTITTIDTQPGATGLLSAPHSSTREPVGSGAPT